MILGLTGGMGCGKSTAARIFEELGFRRIDSDALVRERVLASPESVAEAERRFGAEVILTAPARAAAAGDALAAGGVRRIDRPALARVLFADEAKLHAWEDFVLPRLYVLWKELLDGERKATWVVEVPLLYEKGLEKWFDFVVCVASSSATQLARLSERGVPRTLAEQRIFKQLPLARKIEKADFVLSNDGGMDFLRAQITHLAEWLSAHARD